MSSASSTSSTLSTSSKIVKFNNTDKWRKCFGKVFIASTIALTIFTMLSIFFIVANSNSYHHIHAFSELKTFSIISCGVSAVSMFGSFIGTSLLKKIMEEKKQKEEEKVVVDI